MPKISRTQQRNVKFAFCNGCEDRAIHIATHYYRVNEKIVMAVCKDYLKENKIKPGSVFVREIIKEK